MRFVVVGAGAVGGVVGGRLAVHGHDVVVVARGAHGAAIAESGLHIDSPTGTEIVRLDVATRVAEVSFTPGDVVLLAVKSQDTVDLLDELATVADATLPIVCLQNGVNNDREALRRFANVYAVPVMCPTLHLEPGRVLAYSSPIAGVLDIGRYPSGTDDVAVEVAAALEASTFSSIARPDIMRWKWAKLISNLGNAIEAASGPVVRAGPIFELVRAEATAVLDAAGIERASSAEERDRRGDLVALHPVNGERRPGGSSWQSLARGGGRIETAYLNGEIVMLGRQHGVATPVNERLLDLVLRLAASGAPPGTLDEQELLERLTR